MTALGYGWRAEAVLPCYSAARSGVGASWMTYLDRELAIADNLAYVRSVLDALPRPRTLVLAGFSQGAAMTLDTGLRAEPPALALDPTPRGFAHEGRRYLVTDTVGFIRRLPTQLVEGFAATLEETLVADLVLHVADASLPEERLGETVAAVRSVIDEIGAGEAPVELVLNKIDRVDALGRRRLGSRYPGALQVSAATGEGLDELRARIAELFAGRFEQVRLLVPYEDGATLSELYALGAPIDERADTEEGVLMLARLPERARRRFARYLVAGEALGEARRSAP